MNDQKKHYTNKCFIIDITRLKKEREKSAYTTSIYHQIHTQKNLLKRIVFEKSTILSLCQLTKLFMICKRTINQFAIFT